MSVVTRTQRAFSPRLLSLSFSLSLISHTHVVSPSFLKNVFILFLDHEKECALTKHLFLFSLSLSLCVSSPLSLSLVFATTTEMIKDASSSSSSSSSLFQISAKTLEEAFAQTSYLSYETVKQSTQRASVFAREKALREREKRKEASERAKKELREEHARIEREIERRLERKRRRKRRKRRKKAKKVFRMGTFVDIARRKEMRRSKKNAKNGANTRKKTSFDSSRKRRG